jgi:hypothetical protein
MNMNKNLPENATVLQKEGTGENNRYPGWDD